MNLYKKINVDLKQAMKKSEKHKVGVLRMLLSSLKYQKIEKKGDLDKEDILQVLRKEEKKRLEAIEAFKKVGAQERVEQETKELAMIREYLPEMMREEEIREKVEETVRSLNAISIKDFGKVMGQVMADLKGKADGSMVASLVKESLEKDK